MKLRLICIIFLGIGISCLVRGQKQYHEQWPGFRGPYANGIMDNVSTPVNWNVATGENVKWKTHIPGLGHSCPVIWDDYLFITTAVSGSGKDSLKVGLYGDIDMVGDRSVHEFKIYCLNKNTGEVIWERLSHKGVPKTRRHTKSSHANSTVATDGEHLLVFFGSEGLFCYDFRGNLLWRRDFGVLNAGPYTEPDVEWGFGSSPVIHKDKFIIQCDVTGDDFLGLYEIKTGKEIWKVSREEVTTWSSPAVYDRAGKTRIIVNGYRHMGGYDFETGEEIWKMSGGGDAPVPTPVIAHDLIYINNAHGRYSPIYAVKPDAKGDITLHKDSTVNEFIVWSVKRGGAYMQTPLIYGDYLYNLQVNGLLTCFEAVTGRKMYDLNLRSGGVTASGIASEGKLYFTFENGDVFVVEAGPEYKLLSKNSMGDLCMATPAISEGVIFFRTKSYLIAVGDSGSASNAEK
jgi:outer membrane protein assembly factor BamB